MYIYIYLCLCVYDPITVLIHALSITYSKVIVRRKGSKLTLLSETSNE